MMMEGDFSAKVAIKTAIMSGPTVGVGAVSGARGEITIIDGALVVSYGKPGAHPVPTADTASLLATASCKAWQKVKIDRDVAPQDIEPFIAGAARAHGIDPSSSFPFEAHGAIAHFVMHINIAPTKGAHGMNEPMAITVVRKGVELPGDVAGLYVADDLMGIVTHFGEHAHSHWIAPDHRATAHLDRWGLKAGTTLLLPARTST